MEERSAIESIALGLFVGAYRGTESDLQDETGWREYMAGSDKDIFREGLIMRLYGMFRGIQVSILPTNAKDRIARCINAHFFDWLLSQDDYAVFDREKVERDLAHHFSQYDQAIGALLANQNFTASLTVFESMKGMLKPTLDKENMVPSHFKWVTQPYCSPASL